jgi:glycosyltransferase involved in cell wall biosynthesis
MTQGNETLTKNLDLTISVLVCTRNRGNSLVPTMKSILANQSVPFELVVIDQSTDDLTEKAMENFLDDRRLRYVRSDGTGAGRARNSGLGLACNDVVLITDDDCEVPTDWVEKFASVFAENERIAMAFCNTLPAPGVWEGGCIPTFERTGDLLVTSVRGRCKTNPIGAGMAVRRTVIQALGGFDGLMGPGAPISSSEEDDLALRVLLRGYYVLETDRTHVFHYGFRTVKESKALTYRNYYGTGGGMAKFLKCRQWSVMVVASHIVWATIIVPFLGSVLRLQKPRVVSRVTGFAKGFARGLRMPVDVEKVLFQR